MKTLKETKTGTFVKVAECLYRYDRSGSYFALFKLGGKQKRINLETKDLALAKRLRDQKRRDLERLDIDQAGVPIRSLVESYLETRTKSRKEKTTWKIKRVLDGLCTYQDKSLDKPLGDLDAGKITTSILERCLYDLTEECTVRTRKEYFREMVRFFKRLVADRIITHSPAEAISIDEKNEEIERLIPNLDQVTAVMHEIRTARFSDTKDEAADFLQFMAGAGMGNAETAALKVGDIDFEKDEIRIRRIKTGKYFSIPIFPAVREMLERRTQGKSAGDRVFSILNIKVGLGAACRRLGLPNFSQRAFRRFFITATLDAGVDPRVVAAWQGHKDARLVLEIYSKVTDEKKRQELQKVTFTF